MNIIDGRIVQISLSKPRLTITLQNGNSQYIVFLNTIEYPRTRINLVIGDYIKCHIVRIDEELICSEIIRHYSASPRWRKFDYQKNVYRYSCLRIAIRCAMSELGFLDISLPSIHFGTTKSDSFSFKFFDQPARLSSSNALFTCVAASHFGRVYSLQKVFRSEPSKTYKHLSEFDLLEIGILGCDFDELINNVKAIIYNTICHLKAQDNSYADDICTDFQEVEYSEVENKHNLSGKGLGSIERTITDVNPLFVKYFPQKIASWAAKPFGDKLSYSFNLIVPNVGEIAEGSIRNTNEAVLREKFAALGLSKQLDWTLDMSTFSNHDLGTVGIGVERLAMWLFSVKNIRDFCFFFRDKRFSEQIKTR